MINVTPQTLNNWVYRDRIPHKGIEAIMARFPQVDEEWLRGGSLPLSEGAMPLPEDDEEDDETPQFSSTHFVSGIEPSLGDTPQPDSKEGLVPLQMPRKDIKYVFQCHGDSMLPRIQDGDYVGVGEALGRYEEFRKNVPYLVQTTDGRLMVKMVEDPGPASPFLLLSTENPNYQLADGGRLAKNEFRAAYRVLMVMRDI